MNKKGSEDNSYGPGGIKQDGSSAGEESPQIRSFKINFSGKANSISEWFKEKESIRNSCSIFVSRNYISHGTSY